MNQNDAEERRRHHAPRRRREKYSGRHIAFIGCLILLFLSASDLWTRVEVIYNSFMATTNVIMRRHPEDTVWMYVIPYFTESHMLPQMYKVLFLFACVTLSVVAFCLRNRPKADYVIAFLTLGVFFVGWKILGLLDFGILNWVMGLKALSLLMIVAGCVVNIVQYNVRKGTSQNPIRPEPVQPVIHPEPVQDVIHPEPVPEFIVPETAQKVIRPETVEEQYTEEKETMQTMQASS